MRFPPCSLKKLFNLLKLALIAALVAWAELPIAHARAITLAAAADLKFAMEEIVADFKTKQQNVEVSVVYGSSGKLYAQIKQGAPFDIFFSADVSYPRKLAEAGLGASPAVPYAWGHIVLWSATRDASSLKLNDLTLPEIKRIAIANPMHAPYGMRAKEALVAAGLWEKIEKKLVYGENIAQAAQFVQSGNAQVGILALSLALSPELQKAGSFATIPAHLHESLVQSLIVTKKAKGNRLAELFAEHMAHKSTRAILQKYGFTIPN